MILKIGDGIEKEFDITSSLPTSSSFFSLPLPPPLAFSTPQQTQQPRRRPLGPFLRLRARLRLPSPPPPHGRPLARRHPFVVRDGLRARAGGRLRRGVPARRVRVAAPGSGLERRVPEEVHDGVHPREGRVKGKEREEGKGKGRGGTSRASVFLLLSLFLLVSSLFFVSPPNSLCVNRKPSAIKKKRKRIESAKRGF